MESKNCEYCNKPLKAFTARPDWLNRKAHRNCYKKTSFVNKNKMIELNEYIEKMNKLTGTEVPLFEIKK